MDDSPDPPTPEWLAKINSGIPDFAEAFTVPILRIAQSGRLFAHGSGTLFEIAGNSFLVSASHVLTSIGLESNRLCVPVTGDGHDGFAPLVSDAVCTGGSEPDSSDDPFDLAVWPLDTEIVKRL